MDKAARAANQWLQAYGSGLIGIALIAVFQLLALPDLDKRLTVSLYCFAISIPLLAFFVLAMVAEAKYTHLSELWLYNAVPLVLGIPIWFVGLAAVFFHFSLVIGSIFSLLAILLLLASKRHRTLLKQINKVRG
jgi:hypothetical protein